MTHTFDAIIIGAGQAGPSLAGRLTAAGHSAALIERKLVGGTCVNTDCMPTKALVASAYVDARPLAGLAPRDKIFSGSAASAYPAADRTAHASPAAMLLDRATHALPGDLPRNCTSSLFLGKNRYQIIDISTTVGRSPMAKGRCLKCCSTIPRKSSSRPRNAGVRRSERAFRASGRLRVRIATRFRISASNSPVPASISILSDMQNAPTCKRWARLLAIK